MSGLRYSPWQWVIIALSLAGICFLPFVLIFGIGMQGAMPGPRCSLVDAERVLLSEGTDFVFTVPEAGAYQVEVLLSEHCTSTATVHIAPLRTALRPEPVYEPDEPEHTLELRADEPIGDLLVFAEAGPYILRIEPIPMAMGTGGTPTAAHVRVLVP